MGKTKPRRSIDDFKNAMLTNTKMIGATAGAVKQKNKKPVKTPVFNDNSDLTISPEIMQKLESISEREGIDINDLIDTALNHFIDMESYFFGEIQE